MENKLSAELIEKAKTAKSAEQLLALAKDNGIELTAEQAMTYYEKIHQSGELSDDELDNVSGGGCIDKKPKPCPDCGELMRSVVMGQTTRTARCYWVCDVCGHSEQRTI